MNEPFQHVLILCGSVNVVDPLHKPTNLKSLVLSGFGPACVQFLGVISTYSVLVVHLFF